MERWLGALVAGLLVACAAQPERRATSRSRAPSAPYDRSYECAPQTKLSEPPGDAEIAALERRCVPGQLKDSGSRVTDCPCTELGLALSLRPEPQERARGMRLLMNDCDAGSLLACDTYELERELCLRDPEQPSCSPIRAAGLIHKETLPLSAVLGCRRQDRAVVCLQARRYFVRDAKGEWDQALIESWRREDQPKQARWVAQLAGGARLIATREALMSEHARFPSGYSMGLDPRDLAAAKRAVGKQPRVESRCRAVHKCLEAIATQLAPPVLHAPESGEGEGEEGATEVEVPFTDMLTSLRGCERAFTLGLASLDSQPPPKACAEK